MQHDLVWTMDSLQQLAGDHLVELLVFIGIVVAGVAMRRYGKRLERRTRESSERAVVNGGGLQPRRPSTETTFN